MEGKGASGVADSLSTVCLSLVPQSVLFLTLGPRSTRRRLSGAGACFSPPSETHRDPLPSHKAGICSAEIVNFAVVPPQLRFVFIGAVNLIWCASSPSEVQVLTRS